MSDFHLRKSTQQPPVQQMPPLPNIPEKTPLNEQKTEQPSSEKPVQSSPQPKQGEPVIQLTSQETLGEIQEKTEQIPLENLQTQAQGLSQVKLNAPLNLDLAQTVPLKGPLQISSETFQNNLKSAIGKFESLSSLEKSTDEMVKAGKEFGKSQNQMLLIETSLKDNLQRLSKREAHYNAPLYRLADKMGLKNRAIKLQQLNQERDSIIKNSQQLVSLHQAVMLSEKKELSQAVTGLQQSIAQAKLDGQKWVKDNLNQPGMLWKLSMQSGSQLKETMTAAMLESLPHSGELLSTYRNQTQDYAERVEALKELRAQVSSFNPRKEAFVRNVKKLNETDPEAAEKLVAVFNQEQLQFLAKLRPLADKVNAPGELLNQSGLVDLDGVLGMERLPDAPPSLYQLLSGEKKAYINNLVEGIQASLPNRVLDGQSITLNGVTYGNRTKIAQAGFAEIFTYENAKGDKVVVKQPIKNDFISEEEFANKILKESVNELETYHKTLGQQGKGHPNVLKLEGVIATEQGPLIALEYIDAGNCHDLLEKSLPKRLETGSITPEEVKTVQTYALYQIMQGMAHVQDQNIAHLDIKFDNFFIDSQGCVKVADFGLSKTEAQFNATRQDRGDLPLYLAPELNDENLKFFDGGRPISNKVDIWSVGVMAHKMFEGTFPISSSFLFEVENKLAELDKKRQAGENVQMVPNPQTPEQRFLNRILKVDPQQRESFSELLKDPLFDGLFQMQNGKRAGLKPEVTQLMVRELKNKVTV
ncbi:MAG: protein kinase domain-containing protein [Candidatus Sericytochromatia bacterium]